MYITVDIEVPDWANWMAQDRDGWWYFYSQKPELKLHEWMYINYSGFEKSYKSKESEDWTKELYQIVR